MGWRAHDNAKRHQWNQNLHNITATFSNFQLIKYCYYYKYINICNMEKKMLILTLLEPYTTFFQIKTIKNHKIFINFTSANLKINIPNLIGNNSELCQFYLNPSKLIYEALLLSTFKRNLMKTTHKISKMNNK